MMKNVSPFAKDTVCRLLVLVLLAMTVLSPKPAMAEVTLDTNNPQATFQKDGGQGVTPGPSLVLNDSSFSDHVGFFALDADAATGKEIEVSAAFRVVNNSIAAGVDVGARVIVTDGVTSAIAACVTLGGLPGIGIAIGTDFKSAANYGAFVPVDWLAPVTLKFRRTAAVRELVLVGKPYREIVRLASEQEADIIVMGVQGRGAVDLLFFGSTANHVVRQAPCPVLTVRG